MRRCGGYAENSSLQGYRLGAINVTAPAEFVMDPPTVETSGNPLGKLHRQAGSVDPWDLFPSNGLDARTSQGMSGAPFNECKALVALTESQLPNRRVQIQEMPAPYPRPNAFAEIPFLRTRSFTYAGL